MLYECYTESLGKRIYSRDITVEELNNIVTGLGAKHGTSGEYKGRIRASVTDYPEMEQYSEFSFTATSYNPAPAVLYITGDATEGGWDAAKADDQDSRRNLHIRRHHGSRRRIQVHTCFRE